MRLLFKIVTKLKIVQIVKNKKKPLLYLHPYADCLCRLPYAVCRMAAAAARDAKVKTPV
jgi:hypothetical protein